MGKEESLRKTSQYSEVYKRGTTRVSDLVVLKALPNGLGLNRYGFVVSKRVGGAVQRNRVKRLLREVVRSTSTNSGWDIVLIARVRAATANYNQLGAAVTGSLRRAKILRNDSEVKGMSKV